MSLYENFCPSQIKRQKSQQKETDQLRQSLMQRAKQLKQKMYQEMNFFDYSINHLMTQTLKQIKKHKQDFQEKQGLLIYEQQSEQTKRKKYLLQNQLVQNLQKCKNRYQKHINSIKNKKNRLYTDTKQQSQRKDVEEMLITAKNKFKKKEKQKRYNSEIFNVSSTNKKQPIHTHNRTHNMITTKKMPKLYQKLLKVNQDLTQILDGQLSFPQLNEEQIKQANDQKLQQRQTLGENSPKSEKKEIFLSNNPTKKVLYSPYYRFPTQLRENKNRSKIQTLISQRSVFVPVGKIIRSERKQLQVNKLINKDDSINTNEYCQKDLETNKIIIQTSIVDEAQENQPCQNNLTLLELEEQGDKHSNWLLAKETSRDKSKPIKPGTKRLNYLTQSSVLQSQKVIKLKESKKKRTELMFEEIRGTRIITQFTPTQKQSVGRGLQQSLEDGEKKQIKIDVGIKGSISLGDSKFMNEGTRRDSLLKKSVFFQNPKFKGLSKGALKNQGKYIGDELRQNEVVNVFNGEKKLSRSINLDVRGNNVKLMHSVKFQKAHKARDSDISEV